MDILRGQLFVGHSPVEAVNDDNATIVFLRGENIRFHLPPFGESVSDSTRIAVTESGERARLTEIVSLGQLETVKPVFSIDQKIIIGGEHIGDLTRGKLEAVADGGLARTGKTPDDEENFLLGHVKPHDAWESDRARLARVECVCVRGPIPSHTLPIP